MGVLSLVFDPLDPSRLVVAPQGHELHLFDVSGNLTARALLTYELRPAALAH